MSLLATPPASNGPCGHPLLDRLVEDQGYPHLQTPAETEAWISREGAHVVFLPGDMAKNLEAPDVAVVLPELRMAFQGQFDCAVAQGDADKWVRDTIEMHKTPNLVFFREGRFLSCLPKVRDWSDYMARIPQILALATPTPDA